MLFGSTGSGALAAAQRVLQCGKAAANWVMRTPGRWQRKSSRWRAYHSETRWLSGEERLRNGDVSQLQRSAIFVWSAIFPPRESRRLMEFLSDFGPAFSGANFLSGARLTDHGHHVLALAAIQL
jgi:hypothetical protein